MLAYKNSGTIKPWRGESVNDIKHPLNIEQLWTEAELNAAGLYRVTLFTAPPGKRPVGEPIYNLVGSKVEQRYAIEDIPPPIITVTAAQARVALYSAGLLSAFTKEVATAYPPMKIFFDHAPEWSNDHPYIQALAIELGFDDARLDALFEAASKL